MYPVRPFASVRTPSLTLIMSELSVLQAVMPEVMAESWSWTWLSVWASVIILSMIKKVFTDQRFAKLLLRSV